MVPVRYAVALTAALFLATSVLAQQGRQRRVFTNEDVASPAPAPAPEPAAKPALSEPAAAKSPPAEAAPAEAETSGEAAPADEEAPPPTPKEQLKRMTESQSAFRYVLDEFNKREQSETDSAQQARWREMSQCSRA